ncbi:MAG: histidine triad nucleotide-binding protein [Candidatus Parcubacteria bacterium]|nr:histidine triad nucleotide-binding protein [Candidatus Parcubacteria bacterium]
MDCIFCKIIKKESPSMIIYEDKDIIAFQNIRPLAPVHILVVPKEHIPSVDQLEEKHKDLVGKIFLTAKKVAADQGIAGAYKIVFNVGEGGGQIVFHLHLHLLGGWKSKEDIDMPGMP